MRRALELNRRNFLAGAGISAVAALAGSRRLAAASLAGATEVGLLESRFGAIGDGKHDDTKALQASQQLGRPIRLTDGAVYRVTRRIDISDGGGFVGNGTATIYAPADAFDNRDVTIAGRYGTRSAVLSCSGMKRPPFTPRRRPTLRGIAIKSDPVPGRVVDAVVAQNVVDLRIEKVEILGFPVGCGVRAASLSGDSRIVANNIHDFYDDTVWPPHVLPQITAIEIDNDLVAHRASDSVRIEDNRIANIVVGPHFIAAHGNQSDGINIASWDARRTFIRGNRIDNVGEGIDNFGSYGVIANNIVTRMYYFGIKLIHGASYNIVDNNNVDAAGLAGILLAGSAVAPTDCSWNQITNNIVSNIDPNGMQRGHTTACILTEQNHGTNSLPSHNIIIHNILNPGKNGSYAFFEIGPQRNEFGQNTVFQSGQINLTHGPTRSTR
jgi:hypothetical protein